MAVQGALWLSLNLNFSFVNRISLLLIQLSRGWVDPVSDPTFPEKFLGYSRESNPGPLGWQSDVLATIPNRWSNTGKERIILVFAAFLKYVARPQSKFPSGRLEKQNPI